MSSLLKFYLYWVTKLRSLYHKLVSTFRDKILEGLKRKRGARKKGRVVSFHLSIQNKITTSHIRKVEIMHLTSRSLITVDLAFHFESIAI